MPPACCALQACMDGFEVADIESVVGEVDILTSATGNFDVITLAHMKKMRIDAIVGKSVTSTTKSPWPVSRASLASRWKHQTTGGPVRLPRWARRHCARLRTSPIFGVHHGAPLVRLVLFLH